MKNINLNISKLIVFAAFFLIGCYNNEMVDSSVLIRPSDKYNFELEIQIHNEGRGNIPTLDISKYEFESSEWIYINRIKGKLDASDIILTHYRSETEYPWNQQNIKGYIEFSNDSLIINIQNPYYTGESKTPDKWVDYKYNGKYLIKILNE